MESGRHNNSKLTNTSALFWFNTTGNVSDGFDLDQFILSQLGDAGLNPVHSATVSILYVIIFVTGLLGNLSTCLVIVNTPYLRTAPNCYVFSLALSDVLTLLIGLPVELFMVWKGSYPWALGEGFCVFRVFALETTSSASILTVLVFTLERFNAVCFPMHMHTRAQQDVPHAIVKLSIIWLISAVCGTPFAYFTRTFRLEHPITKQPIEGTLLCNIPRSADGVERLILFQISTFLFFLIPLILIIAMYSMIVVVVRRSLRTIDSETDCSSWHGTGNNQIGNCNGNGNGNSHENLHGYRTNNEYFHRASPVHHRDSKVVAHLMKPVNTATALFVDLRHEVDCVTNPTTLQTFGNSNSSRRRKHESQHVSRRTVMRILIAVVCAFFVCWFPYHLQRLLSVYYTEESNLLGRLLSVLWYISGVLYFASGSVNVVIYHLMSKKYRLALRAMFFTFTRRRNRNRTRNRTRTRTKSRSRARSRSASTRDTQDPRRVATRKSAKPETKPIKSCVAVGPCPYTANANNINHIKTTYVQMVSVVHSSSPEKHGKYVIHQHQIQISDRERPTASSSSVAL